MQYIWQKIFLIGVRNRTPIIRVFQLLYIFLITGGIFLFWAAYWQNQWLGLSFQIARQAGEMAILLYVLTTLPGIVKRFGVKHPLASLLSTFRRYIGITMYLFVLIHAMVMRFAAVLARGALALSTFELYGVGASLIFFCLFITSNDLAANLLGTWWKRIHQLTYVGVWLIFLHVGLQKINGWSILIGLTGIAQLASFGFAWHAQRQNHPSPQVV